MAIDSQWRVKASRKIEALISLDIRSIQIREREEKVGLEPIERAALTFQRVDDVEGSDSLPPGVLGVRDGVADDVLEEVPEDTTDFFVDVAADALDSATPREPANRRLRNALDVFAHDLAMALRTALPKTFTTFAAARHSK